MKNVLFTLNILNKTNNGQIKKWVYFHLMKCWIRRWRTSQTQEMGKNLFTTGIETNCCKIQLRSSIQNCKKDAGISNINGVINQMSRMPIQLNCVCSRTMLRFLQILAWLSPSDSVRRPETALSRFLKMELMSMRMGRARKARRWAGVPLVTTLKRASGQFNLAISRGFKSKNIRK